MISPNDVPDAYLTAAQLTSVRTTAWGTRTQGRNSGYVSPGLVPAQLELKTERFGMAYRL